MKDQLISVIVPTYNSGHKLAATIESVLAQPKDLFELVIVDGGSKDETLPVLEEYRSLITLISEKDFGVYDAMNKGIRNSSGQYLLFLGAGDRLRKGALSQVATMLPKPNLSFVYGETYLVKHGELTVGPFSIDEFRTRNICHQAILYERSLFSLLGEYDLKYKICADWVFNMKCFADRRVKKIYLDVVIADFEGGGISETQNDHRFQADLPDLIGRYVEGNERAAFIWSGLRDFPVNLVSFARSFLSQSSSLRKRQKH